MSEADAEEAAVIVFEGGGEGSAVPEEEAFLEGAGVAVAVLVLSVTRSRFLPGIILKYLG